MRPVNRSEYDADMRERLVHLFGETVGERLFHQQYPKEPHLATAEVNSRHVWHPGLPGGRVYSADQIDLIVEVLHRYVEAQPIEPLTGEPNPEDHADE